jgi:chromosome segregation ATPase
VSVALADRQPSSQTDLHVAQALATLKEEHVRLQERASKATSDHHAAAASLAAAQQAHAATEAQRAAAKAELAERNGELEQLKQESLDTYEESEAARFGPAFVFVCSQGHSSWR